MVSGVVLGVLSLLLPMTAGEEVNKPSSTVRSPILEVVSIDVLDHDAKNPGPALDIRLANNGTGVSVLTAVSFSVEKAGRLEICEPGGPLTSSYEYETQLPLDAAEGDRFTVPVSQELRPNRADRFIIRLGLEAHDPEPGGYVVYLMEVELKHSAPEAVPLGRAAIILPLNTLGAAAEDYSGYLLLDDPTADDFPCYRANRELLRNVSADKDVVVPPKLEATALY